MTLFDNFPNFSVWLRRKLREKNKKKTQTLLNGGEGDKGVRLGDTLDNFTKRWGRRWRGWIGDTLNVGVDYWDVQNEAHGEEDDDGEIVTVVCFVYFCFVLNNFLSGKKFIYRR
jgi:hypothetical protein